MYPYPAGTIDFAPILTALARAAPEMLLSVGRIEDDLGFATQYLQSGMPACIVGLIATPLSRFRNTLGRDARAACPQAGGRSARLHNFLWTV
jgi:hypothetical protein